MHIIIPMESHPLVQSIDPALFKALAEPTRIQILGVLLLAGGTARSGDIGAKVPVDQSVVSRHLRELVRAGVLSVRRQGRERWYAIELDVLIKQFSTLTEQLQNIKAGKACC